MKIKITSEEELHRVCGELLRITVNMRKWQQAWERDYGFQRKQKKKYWEKLMDDYLLTLMLDKTEDLKEIKIEVDGNPD
jgi:hypothetical protein